MKYIQLSLHSTLYMLFNQLNMFLPRYTTCQLPELHASDQRRRTNNVAQVYFRAQVMCGIVHQQYVFYQSGIFRNKLAE